MDRHQDYWGPRERAEEAKALLGSPIYGMAIASLRLALMDALVQLPAGDPQVTVIHIQLKTLDEIDGKLRSYITDYQFRERQKTQ